jgi:GcrA cell cycle regulator
MSDPQFWSERDIEVARALWDEGLSSAEIGRRMGRSKNSVCGLRTRRGWPKRPSLVVLTPEQIAARTAKTRATLRALHDADGAEALGCVRRARKPVHVAPPASPPPEPVPVYLRCQYPLNDRRPWRFCDAVTRAGSVYCAEHHAVCYLRRGERAWMLEAAA